MRFRDHDLYTKHVLQCEKFDEFCEMDHGEHDDCDFHCVDGEMKHIDETCKVELKKACDIEEKYIDDMLQHTMNTNIADIDETKGDDVDEYYEGHDHSNQEVQTAENHTHFGIQLNGHFNLPNQFNMYV